MSFFDVTDPTHLKLIPTRLQDSNDLPGAAETAEADAIAHYTFSTRDYPAYGAYFRQGDAAEQFPYVLSIPSTLPPSMSPISVNGATRIDDFTYVGLKGFDPDPALCDAELAAALRRAIAKIVRHRLAQWGTAANVQREWTNGGIGKDYRQNSEALFPDSWDAELARWDVRPHYEGC